MKRCPVTKKRSFACSVDAAVAFMDMPKMMRVYCCPHCARWHASSKQKSWKRRLAA